MMEVHCNKRSLGYWFTVYHDRLDALPKLVLIEAIHYMERRVVLVLEPATHEI